MASRSHLGHKQMVKREHPNLSCVAWQAEPAALQILREVLTQRHKSTEVVDRHTDLVHLPVHVSEAVHHEAGNDLGHNVMLLQ